MLDNDCVIVPDLGGFVAHHVEAFYDDEEHLFLPPQRTIGFNAQLRMNDSLLAQSYTESYDISYPEAVRRIESEVAELRQHLENDGCYELSGIGTLTLNDEGNIVFAPFESGILTPYLYGLGSFQMVPLATETAAPANEGSRQALFIKMSWLRNAVAVAAAVLFFFLFTSPVQHEPIQQVSKSSIELFMIPKETTTSKPKIETKVINQALHVYDSIAQAGHVAPAKVDTTKGLTTKAQQASETTATAKAANTTKAETPTATTKAAKPETPQTKPQVPAIRYCIVMASQVPRKNADNFVKELHNNGYPQAYVHVQNNVVRVVYGNYRNETEACNELRIIRGNKYFEEAWVMKKLN